MGMTIGECSTEPPGIRIRRVVTAAHVRFTDSPQLMDGAIVATILGGSISNTLASLLDCGAYCSGKTQKGVSSGAMLGVLSGESGEMAELLPVCMEQLKKSEAYDGTP